jgi:hypothetical protein
MLKFAFLVSFLLCPLFTSGKSTPIPETIDMGAYSVTLKLSDRWKVEVRKDIGLARYTFDEGLGAGRGGVQLCVVRLHVKDECCSSDYEKLGENLIINDGLGFRKFVYGSNHRLRLAPDSETKITSPLGEVRCYAFEQEQFGPAGRLFTSVALVIPHDFASRKNVYLVTGLETIVRVDPRYLNYVGKIVGGLTEHASGSIGSWESRPAAEPPAVNSP